MTRLRAFLLAAAVALAGASMFVSTVTHSQEIGQGMVRTGTVGIENDTERKLFWSLICTCGCPRETLGTCTCGWAHERREELRAMLKEGKSIADIQQAYAKQYGTQALAVPPSTGASQLLYVFPLVLIALGAVAVIAVLRSWSRKGNAPAKGNESTGAEEPSEGEDDGEEGGAPSTQPSRDDYDDKLDDELRRLD